jgi:hypothetical protein
MLWSWLAELVLSIATDAIAKLTPVSDPASTWLADPGTAVYTVVEKVSVMAAFVPLGFFALALYIAVDVVLPVAFGIVVGQWVWDHLPHMFGFGT